MSVACFRFGGCVRQGAAEGFFNFVARRSHRRSDFSHGQVPNFIQVVTRAFGHSQEGFGGQGEQGDFDQEFHGSDFLERTFSDALLL